MKNCKLCKLSKACNSLPGFCILLQYILLAVLVTGLGYLFISQELLS